jgi:hypothetical protein
LSNEEEFTYKKPNEKSYLKAVIKMLKNYDFDDIANILKNGKCNIYVTDSFSYVRWNGLKTNINFYVSIDEVDLIDDISKQKLLEICKKIMPAETGLDVMKVNISPLVEDIQIEESLTDDLVKCINTSETNILRQILPNDIIEKGKEMTEIYHYLYCVENSLRIFIENILRDKYGDDFLSNIQLNRSIRENITSRQQQDQKNKWIRIRGDSEVFYLDFKDLGSIIQNNWDLFKTYFPNQNWILLKIGELTECRNLVAHNSYIGEHEKDVIRVNYHSIIKQLENE